MGRRVEARTLLTEGLALARAIDYRRGVSSVSTLLAWLLMAERDFAADEAVLRESLPLARGIGHVDEVAQTLASLAAVYLLNGRPRTARPILVEGLVLADKSNACLALVVCLPVIALYYEAVGMSETAVQFHHAARNQPLFGQSNWYADLFGSRFVKLAGSLPFTWHSSNWTPLPEWCLRSERDSSRVYGR